MYEYVAGIQRLYRRIEQLPQVTLAEIGGDGIRLRHIAPIAAEKGGARTGDRPLTRRTHHENSCNSLSCGHARAVR